MMRFISIYLFFAVSLFSSLGNAKPIHDDSLEKRCYILVGELVELEQFQHKVLCKSKLTSASYKIELAGEKLRYNRLIDAVHHLTGAIEDLHFAIKIECNMKSKLLKVKHDAHQIKHEIF